MDIYNLWDISEFVPVYCGTFRTYSGAVEYANVAGITDFDILSTELGA